MPEPQILEEKDSIEKEIIEKKEAILKESFDNENMVKMAEKIPLDLDSYNFDAFISKMRHESCRPVLENIKRFIKVFLDKLPSSNIEEMVEAYKSFYSVIKLKCLQTEIWRSEETTAMERANALEGLESLIMNQLHDRVITFDASEKDLDNFMERKMALHAGWIKMEHLDLAENVCKKLEENEETWISTAVTEFQKMSVYRTPRDKLVCALNGCKIINSLINGNEMSADDFLPLLIYTLIRANPPQIYSNINYISRFRAPERITGETAYCFTHLMAAIEFIEKMDRNALKISEESYETFMEAAIQEFNQRPLPDSESQDSLEISFNEKLDIAEAKAEELFIKAKEAFKVTGERANQAFSSFKESNLAKKSMEKINKFWKDIRAQDESRDAQDESRDAQDAQEDFESQLARAVSLSLMDESIELESESEKELKDEEEEDKTVDQVKASDKINDDDDDASDKNIK